MRRTCGARTNDHGDRVSAPACERRCRFEFFALRGGRQVTPGCAQCIQLAEIELFALGDKQPIASAAGTFAYGHAPEHVFDGSLDSKWLATSASQEQPYKLDVTVATDRLPDAYRLWTASDAPIRDPISWRVECTDGAFGVVQDIREGVAAPFERLEPYSMYRLGSLSPMPPRPPPPSPPLDLIARCWEVGPASTACLETAESKLKAQLDAASSAALSRLDEAGSAAKSKLNAISPVKMALIAIGGTLGVFCLCAGVCLCMCSACSDLRRIRRELADERAARAARRTTEGVPLVQVVRIEKPSDRAAAGGESTPACNDEE